MIHIKDSNYTSNREIYDISNSLKNTVSVLI